MNITPAAPTGSRVVLMEGDTVTEFRFALDRKMDEAFDSMSPALRLPRQKKKPGGSVKSVLESLQEFAE